MHKIAVATRKGVEDAGGTYQPHPAEAVVEKMIGWKPRSASTRGC
ncbi:Putative fatty acid oxidation protein FadB [Mycobacterium tuberculosis]|nr:Putative fatty acid oxidation protein FadB [Mycobacterium tuberculosis]